MSKEMLIPKTVNPDIEKAARDWVFNTFGPNASYDESLQPTIDQWGLPWFRAGAVVCDAFGNILLMHEGRVQVKKVKDAVLKDFYLNAKHLNPSDWVDGDGGWNIPAGRLRLGESFEDAVLREIKEESGWTANLGECIYYRYGDNPKDPFIMPVFLCQAVSGPKQYQTSETRETLGIDWFTSEGIHALNQIGALRSPKSVMDSLAAYKQHCASIIDF